MRNFLLFSLVVVPFIATVAVPKRAIKRAEHMPFLQEYKSRAAVSEYDFSNEPEEQVNLNLVADTAVYLPIEEGAQGFLVRLLAGENYDVIIQLNTTSDQLPTGTFPLNYSGENGTAQASVGRGEYDDEASFMFVYDDEGWYLHSLYFVSGEVTLSKDDDGLYSVSISATTAKGSTVSMTYHGTIVQYDEYADATYDAEPKEVSELNLVPKGGYFIEMYDNLGFILGFRQGDTYEVSLRLNTPSAEIPLGTFPIDFSLSENTVSASRGGYEAYDLQSYVWVNDNDGMYSYSYYLVSGTMTIDKQDDNYVINLDALSYNGSTITMAFNGKLKDYGEPITDYSYDDEPEQTVQVEQYADIYSFEDWGDGVFIVHLYSEPYHAQVKVTDSKDVLEPNGRFDFAQKDGIGVAKASLGGNETLDDYSFIWEIQNDYWLRSYYLADGYIDIHRYAPDNDNLVITLEATSYKGSTFKLIYDESKSAVEDVTAAHNSSVCRKIIRDERLVIQLPDGREYDATGAAIK